MTRENTQSDLILERSLRAARDAVSQWESGQLTRREAAVMARRELINALIAADAADMVDDVPAGEEQWQG